MFASNVVADQARVQSKTNMRSFSGAQQIDLGSLEASLRVSHSEACRFCPCRNATAYDDFPMHQCAGGITAAKSCQARTRQGRGGRAILGA
jgi:hypothetical protein